jgi:maltooligosyltrehalose trehalohydrolase
VRAAAGDRRVVLVAENEPQDTRLVRPLEEGGYGLDALWNDDWHHSAMVALTSHSEAYYSETSGDPQEFVSAAKYGYLFQGQYYHWQRNRRGTPSWGLPPAAFVSYLQNHDQIANSARGLRGHQLTSPGRWRALSALLLLQPSSPLLFQGQEFSASARFLYFADFDAELAAAVRTGRAEFLAQFPSLSAATTRDALDDPGDSTTFEQSILDLTERKTHAEAYALYRDLLKLRREDTAFRLQRLGAVDGAVLSANAFALRFFTDDHRDDRLLIVNLGRDLKRTSIAEPLLAPPPGLEWSLRWASEDRVYGGGGTPPLRPQQQWCIPGESAVVFATSESADAGSAGIRRRTA